MTDRSTLLELAERYQGPSTEEMQVSQREHPDVSPGLLRLAIGLACDRGGSTIPVSEYDIKHARDLFDGEQSENVRLRGELRQARAEIITLRALANQPEDKSQ